MLSKMEYNIDESSSSMIDIANTNRVLHHTPQEIWRELSEMRKFSPTTDEYGMLSMVGEYNYMNMLVPKKKILVMGDEQAKGLAEYLLRSRYSSENNYNIFGFVLPHAESFTIFKSLESEVRQSNDYDILILLLGANESYFNLNTFQERIENAVKPMQNMRVVIINTFVNKTNVPIDYINILIANACRHMCCDFLVMHFDEQSFYRNKREFLKRLTEKLNLLIEKYEDICEVF